MQKGIKKLHEFNKMEEFLYYVHRYMQGIARENVIVVGEPEIHLKTTASILGIWRRNQNYGFIEEYRNKDRVRAD